MTSIRQVSWAVIAALVSALAWVAAFATRLSQVDSDSWQWRDDAVITLSHAVNLVQFGSVGVSPGGDRVEGFSTPLQFLVAVVAFAVEPMGYRVFIDGFVWIGAGTAGALSALIALRVALSTGYTARWAAAAGVGVAALAALVTASSWTTLGWLSSGMENPLVLVLGLLVLLVGVSPFRPVASPITMALALGLLGLTRIELPALLVPTVVVAAVVLARQAPAAIRRRTVLIVLIGPAAIWGATTALRWAYFGDLLPNTAVVQGKASGLVSFVVIGVVTAVLLALVAFVLRAESPARRLTVIWGSLSAVSALALATIVAKNALGQDPLILGYWYPDPGYAPLLVMLVVTGGIMALVTHAENRLWAPDLLFAMVSLLPLIQYLAMGPARLDVFRIASISLPFLAVWLETAIVRLCRVRVSLAVGVVVVLMVTTGAFIAFEPVRGLCCKISPSEEDILAVADTVRVSELGGTALPIVATADLGKLSFAKRSIIVDLGWLGDPVLARLHRDHPELEAQYLAEVAAPDVVEMHGGWPCWHAAWFDSPTFVQRWVLATSTEDPPLPGTGCDPSYGASTWIRSDAEAEYGLTRELAASDDPAAVVRSALSACTSAGTDPLRCQGVRRAVTRASQDLRDSGQLEAVVDALSSSPSAALDIPLVERGPGWADAAVQAYTQSVRGG